MGQDSIDNADHTQPGKAGGQRARRVLETVRHSARIGGRTVIDNLPISPSRKLRCKYLILSVVGPLFGVPRGRSLTPYAGMDIETRLKTVNERYRELAASACGYASDTPPRSVSIVVPVYNQLDYTIACIDAIKENTSEIDYEIIVVDDCSSDETQKELSGRDDIVYLRNEKNLGFIGSCNAGAKHASNTYLCFLNNDTTVLPYWLSALVNTFELHERVGLVGSKLVYPDGRLQEAGGLVWEDGSAWNWGKFQDPENPQYNYARHADYCSGASILIPKVLFESLGGFDSHYAPAYYEDTDLAFKVRALGLATIYQPLSQVVHFEGVTSGTDTSQGVKKHQVINAEKFEKRWAPVLTHHGRSENAATLADRGVVGHILALDQITPEPDRDAGSIAALEMMRALRKLGYKITFVPCSNLCDMPPYTSLLAALGFESVVLPWTSSVTQHLKDRGSSYDAVLIFRPQTWHDYIDEVRRYAPQAKLIYYACDLHYLRHQREADIGSAPTKAAAAKLAASKETELDLISSSDLCILHSTVEKQLIEAERPSARIVCFPLTHEPRGRGKSMAERSGILFLGGYRHPPNIDAVEHYVADIHPRVKKGLSEPVMFTAAGSSPTPAIQMLAGEDISVPGYIEDITPLLYEARLMVAPLRYGAGVKGKILTAMAHGLPVVTTTFGAEGITDGDELLIANDPKTFADAVCRLHSDSELWHRLQSAALNCVRETTSREVGELAMASVLQQLGLPSIETRAPSDGNDVSASSGSGSPSSVGNIGAFVEASRHLLPGAEHVDLVLIPNSAPTPVQLPKNVGSIALYSQLAERLPTAKAVVVVVDPTDLKLVEKLDRELNAHLPAEASCAIVVAPQRMVASSDGYTIMEPFSDRAVDRINVPYHEALTGHFQFEDRHCVWHTDKSQTGFPSLTVLCISKRATTSS